jgi:transcriptional regulator with XRE-family HTH domain
MLTIGQIIKKLRKSLGMTQAQLADELGTLQKVISDYESGRAKPPRDRLPLLAKALSISIDELLGTKDFTENRPKTPNKNKRSVRLLDAFEKLKPDEQRLVLRQTLALAGEKDEE